MELIFAFDRFVGNDPVPNLIREAISVNELKSRNFDLQWPRIVLPRILLYLTQANIKYECCDSKMAPAGSFYPVNFGWFDFDLDYFELLPDSTKQRVRNQELKIIFFYHEGDNPSRIRKQLNLLSENHRINKDYFLLVSANTAAQHTPGCMYFDDHERFFSYANRHQSIDNRWSCDKKNYDFTLLNRRNKWWRASITADLHRHNILSDSLWSYDTDCDIEDLPDDNPISIFEIPGLHEYIETWIRLGPYKCDSMGRDQQHKFGQINSDLYLRSWFHLIVESQYDCDQSGGAFITEKTYKCIKYGQPFVMIGPAGTLKQLRSHGYRVFDDVIDNSYDEITDNTQRWLMIRKLVTDMKHKGLQELWKDCQSDISHNMQLFHHRLTPSLNSLIKEINGYFSK
jgi:hypothetical protein